jgi:hypothetical protein
MLFPAQTVRSNLVICGSERNNRASQLKRNVSMLNARHSTLAALFCLLSVFRHIVLGADPTAVVAVENSGNAFIVDALMGVQVPPETAWNVLIDFDHMASILGNMAVSKVVSRNGNTLIVRQEGTAKYGLLSFPFVSEREIHLEPMRRIVTRSLSGTFTRMESESQIVPLDHGVQIRYHAEIVPDSLLARLFGKSFISHEIDEQFVLLGKEMTRRYALAEPAAKSSELLPARIRLTTLPHWSDQGEAASNAGLRNGLNIGGQRNSHTMVTSSRTATAYLFTKAR